MNVIRQHVPIGLALLIGIANAAAQVESTNSLVASGPGSGAGAGLPVESTGSFVMGSSDAAAGIYRMQDSGGAADAGTVASAGPYSERSGGVAIVNNPPMINLRELAFTGRPDSLQVLTAEHLLSVSDAYDVDGDPISYHLHSHSGLIGLANRFATNTVFSPGESTRWFPPVPVLGVDLFLSGRADDGSGFSEDAMQIRGRFAPILRVQEATNRTARLSETATLNMVVDGTGPLTNQWFRNGGPLIGQTSAQLNLEAVQRSDAAVYALHVSNAYGNANSHDVNFRVLIPQQLLAPEALPGGGFRIRFGDHDGELLNELSPQDYSVQWSTDLQTWHSLTNAILQLASGVVEFQDSHHDGRFRFYRVGSN